MVCKRSFFELFSQQGIFVPNTLGIVHKNWFTYQSDLLSLPPGKLGSKLCCETTLLKLIFNLFNY